MDLCSRCQAFNVHAFARHKYPWRGYRLRHVIEAAGNGCSFCAMLADNLGLLGDDLGLLRERKRLQETCIGRPAKWYSMEQISHALSWAKDLINPTWVHFSAKHTGSDDSSELGIVALQIITSLSMMKPDGSYPYSMTLHTAADPGKSQEQRTMSLSNFLQGTEARVSGDIVGKLYTESHTSASTYVEAIKLWHDTCRIGHWECSRTMSNISLDVRNAPLPSRCLEVIPNDLTRVPDAEAFAFVLRDTSGRCGSYTALSHRWDQTTVWNQTTKQNLNCRMNLCEAGCQHCHDQPLGLTPLFKDVAILSARIGINYVWIDSLCIVQDCSKDWRQESAKMADYYQRSWLTIFATSLSTDGGLFGPIPRESVPRVTRLPYRDAVGHPQGYFYLQCIEEVAPSADYKDNISQSELLRRGWVYQEWTLSRRKLMFSGAGLYVQCQREAPRTLLGDTVRDTAHSEYANSSFRIKNRIMTRTPSAVIESWLTTVQIFSELELTKLEEDRLIALAGLAKECGRTLRLEELSSDTDDQPRYISGLWFGYWRCLMWEQASGGEKVRASGFPTWSWASIATRKPKGNGERDGERVLSGMPVQWTALPEEENLPTCELRFEAVCAVPVEETIRDDCQRFEPLYDQSTTMRPNSSEQYNASNRFHMLEVTGKLLPVLIDRAFETAEDADMAAELTHHSTSFRGEWWRRVTMLSTPSVISGWASLEHPEYQTDNFVCSSGIVALVVTSRRGNFLGLPASFEVIFLRCKDVPGHNSCYERVGVGGLFGSDVQALVQVTGETSMWLV